MVPKGDRGKCTDSAKAVSAVELIEQQADMSKLCCMLRFGE